MSTSDKNDIAPANLNLKLAVLTWLYTLQGATIGLTDLLLFIMNDNYSLAQLATFSLSRYPFAAKILWAPIVDGLRLPGLGQRLSWVVPTQLLAAFVLWSVADLADSIGVADPAPSIGALTTAFTMAVVALVSQDVAVDAWAVSLLPGRSAGWAATCQTVGLYSTLPFLFSVSLLTWLVFTPSIARPSFSSLCCSFFLCLLL